MATTSRVFALLAMSIALAACSTDAMRNSSTASSGSPSYNLAIPGTESSPAPPPASKMEGDNQSSGVKTPAGG
jgi:hypothetical protein